MITNISKAPEFPERIRAYHRVLSIIDKGVTVYLGDINTIEGWMLDQAHEQGYGEVIKQFRQL